LRIGSTLNGATGYEMPLNTIRVPKSAEDTRAIVRTVLGAGVDYVIFYDGAMPLDYYKAGVDEAHKLGKPAFVRAFRCSSDRGATTAMSWTSTRTWTRRRRPTW
jgi:hypothetical protein